MKPSKACVDLVKQFEGFRPTESNVLPSLPVTNVVNSSLNYTWDYGKYK